MAIKKRRKAHGLSAPYSDDHAARDLELTMESDYRLQNQRKSIDLNQAKKACKGVWAAGPSAKLFRYLVDNGAKNYVKDMGERDPRAAARMFPGTLRNKVAAEYAADFKTRYNDCIKGDCGDFDAATTAAIKKCKAPTTLAGARRRKATKKRRK